MSRIGLIVGAVGLTLLVVLLVLQVMSLVPGSSVEPTGITVMAQGKAPAEPDLAVITVGVETRDLEAREAAKKNDEQMAEVMAALHEMGVTPEDIQTVDYSIRAEIDWSGGEQRVLGYVVNNSVLVNLRDLDKVGDVVGTVTEAGANSIYGIQFSFDDPSALRETARTEAMAEAQKKAEALAGLAGVRLGRPRYISESFTEPSPYYTEQAYVASEGMGYGGASVVPGQLEVVIQVQATYDIR